jgi:hypothetical protein
MKWIGHTPSGHERNGKICNGITTKFTTVIIDLYRSVEQMSVNKLKYDL